MRKLLESNVESCHENVQNYMTHEAIERKKNVEQFTWNEKRFLIINFFCEFVNNFLKLLLGKIDVLDICNMADFFQIFVVPQITEILINFNSGGDKLLVKWNSPESLLRNS